MTTAFQPNAFQQDAFQEAGGGAIAYTLDCETGSYLYTGQDATLVWSGAVVPGGGGLANDPRFMGRKRRYRKPNVKFKPNVEETVEAVDEPAPEPVKTEPQDAPLPRVVLRDQVLPRVVLPDLALPRVILPPLVAQEAAQEAPQEPITVEYRPVRRLLERIALEPAPEPAVEPEPVALLAPEIGENPVAFLEASARAAAILEEENDRRRQLLIRWFEEFEDAEPGTRLVV